MFSFASRAIISCIFIFAAGLLQSANAQCTVPNMLTNGQPADASQVMTNFNALAACVNSAPAGPAGALQYNSGSGAFGGVAPLSDGQIAIGSTGNPPQAASITAGTGIVITNGPGSITIRASGSGGGGGLYDTSMGVPTTYMSVNIGGNSSATSNGSLALTIAGATSTPTSPELYGVAVAAPSSTPYLVAVLSLPNFSPIKYTGLSLGFRESATGKLVVLTSFNGSAFGFTGYSFENWSSATSRVSLYEPSVPRAATTGPTWFGIQDDGSTVSFFISQDGASFYPLGFSQAKSGGYLAAYDQIFIGMFTSAESGSDGSANNNSSVTYLAYDPNGLTRKAGP